MEQKLFHHFPGVICVDTVNKTNKDKRPLLTLSGRGTHGKMFIFLHQEQNLAKMHIKALIP